MKIHVGLDAFCASLDLVPVAVVMANPKGTIVHANPMLIGLFDCVKSNILGENIQTFKAQDLDSAQHADREICLREPMTEGSEVTEIRASIKRNGAIFDAEWNSVSIRIQGDPYILTTIHDISAVQSSGRMLTQLIESLDAVAWEANGSTFQFTYISKNVENLLGYPVEHWLHDGSFWKDHVHEDDRSEAVKFCTLHTQNEKNHEFEYRMIAADGRIVWIRDTVNVVRTSSDGLQLRGLFVDITQRKKEAAEKIAMEARLQNTQKMESLAVLAGGIAHDFNNLLVGILGNAGLVLRDLPAESPVISMVETIESAANRAADLTKQLLAYSGKGRFVVKTLDVNLLINEMAHLLETVVSKTAILKLDLAPDLPPITADGTQIRQVVMNLITNASDAIGDKSGVISITSGLVEADANYLGGIYMDQNLKPGPYVFIEVTDTGIGMDETTRAKIFDPFFSTKFTGRGLGLAATLGIVNGHGGTIRVYSEVGRGTAFKILLPAAIDQVATPEDNSNGHRSRAKFDGKVLIVDDDETVCAVLKRILQSCGLEVVAANDGTHGVALFEKDNNQFDIIFLDLTMPHMGGEEAFRRIRSMKSNARVVIMSGYNEQEITTRFVGKGLAAFLQKPFHVEQVIEVVNQIMG